MITRRFSWIANSVTTLDEGYVIVIERPHTVMPISVTRRESQTTNELVVVITLADVPKIDQPDRLGEAHNGMFIRPVNKQRFG
jgi:hypothetical protein